MSLPGEGAAAGGARPAILFLAHLLPWPLEGGGQIKSYHTLRILAQKYDVTMLALIRRREEETNLEPLRPLCVGGVRTILIPRSKVSNVAQALGALVRGRSFIIERDDVPAMREAVKEALRGKRYASVHVDHLQMAQFVPEDTGGAKVVLDHHNIEHRIPQRMAETPGASPLLRFYGSREWPKLRDYEIAACRRADLVLTVSEEDAAGLRAIAPDLQGRIAPVPIGVDTEYFGVVQRRRPDSKTLLSIGTMSWPPNVDSMLYFCREIFPKVKEKVPEARLCIVGAKPTEAIRALAEADPAAVTVTGSVPDVRPYADDCGAFIVPLRSGSGMRVKILNALAMGLPVVSTTVGAEGIEVTHERNILLADGAEAFAGAVVRVLSDEALAERLSREGRRLMDEWYSWDVVGKRLLSVYDGLLSGGARVAA